MRKIDVILVAVIGLLNGIFFLVILTQARVVLPYGIPGWILLPVLPILAILGLSLADSLGKKIAIIFQAAKFLLVGTLNTFIDIGILNLLIWLTDIKRGVSYSLFKTVSFLLATTNSYFWNKFWTFEKGKEKVTPKEFLKFLVVTTVGLSINVGVASFVVNVIGPKFAINENIWAGAVGPIIAAFFAFVWNFFASKFIIFK